MTRGNLITFLFSILATFYCGKIATGQTDAQLRDPDFLIKQYNDLAAKHNALVEKTRTVVMQQLNAPPVAVASTQAAQLQDDLNEALGQIAALIALPTWHFDPNEFGQSHHEFLAWQYSLE